MLYTPHDTTPTWMLDRPETLRRIADERRLAKLLRSRARRASR